MPDARPVCLDCGKPGRWLCAACFDRRLGIVTEAQDRVIKTAEQPD